MTAGFQQFKNADEKFKDQTLDSLNLHKIKFEFLFKEVQKIYQTKSWVFSKLPVNYNMFIGKVLEHFPDFVKEHV